MRLECVRGIVAVASACALLVSCSVVVARADSAAPLPPPAGHDVVVAAASPSSEPALGEALGELVALAVRMRGVEARVVDAPVPCLAGKERACVNATLRALAAGTLDAALVPLGAAPPLLALRDAGLEDLGDAAPASRRACLVSAPQSVTPASPLRSLLDLADQNRARPYHHRDEVSDCTTCEGTFVAEWCGGNAECATLLTSDTAELAVLTTAVRRHRLHATVRAVGGALSDVARRLADSGAGVLVCDRAPSLSALANLSLTTLGPPPCAPDVPDPCPFESRRLAKLVNVRSLARAAGALQAVGRMSLSSSELRRLATRAREANGTVAARDLAASLSDVLPPREARAVVLLPIAARSQAYDALELTVAAAIAEEDIARTREAAAPHFKVEVYDDGCSATLAYKYLTDALGTGDYGALSGAFGPACGAAFSDVARQSPAHGLPVVAYSVQGAAEAAGGTALLAGGGVEAPGAALGALLAALGWRRLAALSEPATRAHLAALRKHSPADLLLHLELPDAAAAPQPDLDVDLIDRWVQNVAAANGRVIYLCLEDARAVRAALCAGRAAGLTPQSGTVWLLPGTLPPGWLQDSPNCTREQLAEVADGHMSIVPAWFAAWDDFHPMLPPTPADEPRRAWTERWSKRCLARASRPPFSSAVSAAPSSRCSRAGPHAALLYDTLRLWAAALARLLARRPAALDDLHEPAVVRWMIANATETEYEGLTGRFEWTSAEGGRVRTSSVLIRQWELMVKDGSEPGAGTGGEGRMRTVWMWRQNALEAVAAPHWRTSDGLAPDDGGEQCALQPLADALRSDCRAALLALGALVLAALLAALAAAALHCRRRAERKYRERLAALGLTRLTPAGRPAGLDRWEVPRERVVINRKLGTGAFGTVYGGHALLAEDRGWTAVAVKTLKAGATTEEKLDFLSEAEAMKRFEHKNVVRLLGVVTKTEPVCTVMEFMLYGDLKNYLLARRHLAVGAAWGAEGEAGEEVSARRLTSMALDVARALSYLAQLRYVHRDVAARNCLVSAHRVVKLADFGMTRLVFEHDYYRFSRKGMLPVRWMAPESLALGVFSPASDVWSFGVLLYEIVTFGSLPFQGLSNSEVLTRVKGGHTLDLPSGLKPQLEGLIKSCWQQDYKARPSASEVAAFLADWPRLLAPCLDVPLDALPLDADAEPPWRLPRDRAEARWVSWAAPASATTDTTYLSTDTPQPRETDSFLS